MPGSATVKSMVKKFYEKYKEPLKLGKQIGTPSSYGAVFEIVGEKNKVVKIFKSRTLGYARREAYISIAMGREGVGPKVYKVGMVGVEPGNLVIYTIMEKIDGDLYSLRKKNPTFYRKNERRIKKEVERLIQNMHKRKFVHADLKEDNLAYKMVKGKIQLYIIDFGFSSLMPFSIKTNRNLARAIVRAYKDQGYSYQNLINGNAVRKVQHRYNNELFRNKILKITMKKGINIDKVYKKMDKKKFKKEMINLIEMFPNNNNVRPGVFRYKLANEHWIIFNPGEIIHNEPEGKGRYLRNRLSN